MKKAVRLYGLAALFVAGIVMAGCSKENDPEDGRQEGKKVVTLTATVDMGDDNPESRMLDAQGVKTFQAGEMIAVVFELESGLKTVVYTLASQDISGNGKRAGFTVSLELEEGQRIGSNHVDILYPGDQVNEQGQFDEGRLCTGQDGTLETISSLFDWCDAQDVAIEEDGDGYRLSEQAILVNRLAIAKFSAMESDGTTAVDASRFKVRVINRTTDQARTYRPRLSGPVNTVWLAMMPVASDEMILLNAGDESGVWVKRVAGKDLEAGHIYPVKLKMEPWDGDLSALLLDAVAQDGMTLSGTLSERCLVSVADGAAVTLQNVEIEPAVENVYPAWEGDGVTTLGQRIGSFEANGGSFRECVRAGITCLGDATLTLVGENKVTGLDQTAPGIFISGDKTLTINGEGSLEVSPNPDNGTGAGIGGGALTSCGNIVIEGGTVEATGGVGAAAIGSGSGDGSYTPGCGDITVCNTVTKVVAIKGQGAVDCIGKGNGNGECGMVAIGNIINWDGDQYQNDGENYLCASSLTYIPDSSVEDEDAGKGWEATLYDEELTASNRPSDILLNDVGSYIDEGVMVNRATGALVQLNRNYALGRRLVRFRAVFSQETVALFRSGSDLRVRVNVPQKTVSILSSPQTTSVEVPFLSGEREYDVEIVHEYQKATVRIVDVKRKLSATVSATQSGAGGVGQGVVNYNTFSVGTGKGNYYFGLENDSFLLVKRLTVEAPFRSVRVLIYGDSITEPEGYYPTELFPQAWTQLVIHEIETHGGQAISGGWGGCQIGTVRDVIRHELPYLDVQYVMVTIGTNGGNTESNLTELMNYIIANGAIPILNNIPSNESGTQIDRNVLIEEVRNNMGLNGVRFDLATSLEGDGLEVDKTMMFWENYPPSMYNGWQVWHHPNEVGAAAMFEQALIDVPEIFE